MDKTEKYGTQKATAKNVTDIYEKFRKQCKFVQGAFMSLGIAITAVTVVSAAFLIWEIFTKDSQSLTPNSAVFVYDLIFMSLLLIYTAKLFREFSLSYTPFSVKMTKVIRTIAWIMYFMFMAPILIDKLIDLLKLNLTHISDNFLETFLGIIFATIFFLLSYIFDYGRLLQQQTDETL